MATKRLTALSVASIQPKDHRIEIPDGGARGLYLVVQPSGKKSFAVRYRHNGRPCKLTLGSGLSLAAARELAAKALHDLERGIDPGQTKKKEKADAEIAAGTTLRAICESYLRYEESKPADRRLRTVSQRRATVTRLVLPHKLAGRPIGEIRRGELIALLDDVETTRGPRMADEVLATLRRIFDWHALRDESFRTPLIKGMARTKPKERQRSRVLSDAELCKVWRVADGMGPFGSFVQFLLLTCTRRSEAAHARWSEMSNGDWTIPSARYKSKHDHAIPLSGAARALLAKQPRFAGCDYIFTSDGQRPVAYSHGKRRLDELSGVTNWRLHDARRSARTLLSRAAITSDISERCLGHAVGGIRAVYDRHSFRAEMAHAFEALAALIERIVNAPEGGNVVPLAGPFARPWPLVDPPPHRKPLPPTQTLQPSLFINENKFFPPLVQQVPTKARMLNDEVTSAELKHVLDANAEALRHGGEPTTLGYGTDWATIQERAAERLRVKSEQLKAHEKDRTAAKDRRRRKWNAMDATIRKDEPDLRKRDRAKKIAAKLGGSWRVIERHIPK